MQLGRISFRDGITNSFQAVSRSEMPSADASVDPYLEFDFDNAFDAAEPTYSIATFSNVTKEPFQFFHYYRLMTLKIVESFGRNMLLNICSTYNEHLKIFINITLSPTSL